MDAASAAAIPAKAAEKPPELRVPTVDDDQVERFTAELTALGGRAYRIHRREISERVISFLRERGIDAAQMWEGIPGMDAARLTQAGLRVVRSGDGAIRAGVTGARAGIAETGTLVILGGRGQPLTASLLPEIHIAVLQASEIVTSLEEALNLPGVREASAATLVAGPSRTGDIEMTLTIGVHGPKELHVFVVDD